MPAAQKGVSVMKRKIYLLLTVFVVLLAACVDPLLGQKIRINYFLMQGVIPIIDVQSTLTEEKMNQDFPGALTVMDELGIAQIAFEGKQAQQQDPPLSGYRWSYYINNLVAQYPKHLFLTANGGSNNNWAQQKDNDISYIVQLEREIRTGDYKLMGEFEFRHYMSKRQCLEDPPRTGRDVTVPINSSNGHRVFQLSHDTGVPFVIHYEPEDALISSLETMLDTYPNAKVIWAHFGQLREPGLMTEFGPVLVERLLTDHPNLYFDLATGHPNRRYPCSQTSDNPLDTVIWQKDEQGVQTQKLIEGYQDIFERFSDRFVSAADYGGNRPEFSQFYSDRMANLRLIMEDLSDQAKHNISYKNAWFLLTGTPWDG
jgi:hypothetical protein